MMPTARIIHTRPPTGTPRRATCPGEGLPISYAILGGSGRGCPQLRASNEHSFTVRVLRARRAPGRSLLIPLTPRVARARGSSQPPPSLFSILLRSCSRQVAHNPLCSDRPVTDTVRNPNAAIAGPREDQSSIETECCLNLIQPFEM